MTVITKDAKSSQTAVERFEYLSTDEEQAKDGIHRSQAMGTVTITDDTDIYLVPAPSADPRGKFVQLAFGIVY